MREIKFRAWDILGKRMLQWGDIFHLPAWEIFPGTPEQRAFNIMQYTGLHDKNGKEVYEGDVLSCIFSNVIGEPHFEIMGIKNMTDYELMASLNYAYEIEVIGNIYENPELLGNEI